MDILAIRLSEHGEITLTVSAHALALGVLAALLIWAVLWRGHVLGRRVRDFEVDTATIGIGKHKFNLKPNETDRQLAYAVWVELSTRKLGLPIDLDHDVIAEIYGSWYAFFGLTRDLIKGIPVNKVRRDGTRQIVELSIEVLNEGIRPHLTRWNARYRHWLDTAAANHPELSPQDLQRRFPEYDAMVNDLMAVNSALARYREKMHELAIGKG